MKKKATPKYQIGSPCGEGTVWSEELQQCIPARPSGLNQQTYNVDNTGTPITDYNYTPSIQNGQVIPGGIVPLIKTESGDMQYDPLAGTKDSAGNFVPYNKTIGEALDNGYNYDEKSNQYQKTTQDNNLEFSPLFQFLNTGLDITRGIAGTVNNAKSSKAEREKLLKARYNLPKYDINDQGYNNVPIVFKGGGKNKQIPATTQDSLNVARNAANVANYYKNNGKYQILNDKKDTKNFNEENERALNAIISRQNIGSETVVPKNNIENMRMVLPSKYYYQKVNENQYYQRELSSHVLDTRAPFTFFDKRIQPQTISEYQNIDPDDSMVFDNVALYKYDPIAVTPWNNLTPEQKMIRAKKYGTQEQKLEMGLIRKPTTPTSTPDPQRLKSTQPYTSPIDNSFPEAELPNLQPINVQSKYNPISQNKTDYSFTYRNENGSQSNVYFNNEEDYNNALNANKKYPYDKNFINSTRQGKSASSLFNFKPQFATGGEVMQKAELEQGEIFTTLDGTINKVPESHDRHEDGGSIQHNVDRVLEDTSDKRKDWISKLLKINPDVAEDLTGFKPKTDLSHSKLYEQASEFHAKKQNKDLKHITNNIEYVEKQNGGIYAANSLNLNVKNMEAMPTPQDLFDSIYNHQETQKQKYNVPQPNKFKIGGKDDDEEFFLTEDQKKQAKKLEDTKGWKLDSVEGNKSWWIQDGKPGQQKVVAYSDRGKAKGGKQTTNPVKYIQSLVDSKYEDLVKDGYIKDTPEHKQIYDNARTSKFGVQTTPGTPEQYGYTEEDNMLPNVTVTGRRKPPVPTSPNYGFHNTDFENKFNEPLRWYDVAGNTMNYLSSLERTPVDLEQLRRDPLRVHELNPLPAMQQNQNDFNTVLDQLPTNGVGFANAANLAAGKYAANNQILGQYENQNKTRYDAVDQYNDQNQYQVDTTNLGLRDQFNNRVLQSKEIQRQSKLNALDDLFTKVAQNRKLNREGNLVLEMTPYFNQYGQFNGRDYNIVPSNNGMVNIVNKQTGQVERQTTQQELDKNGQLIKTKNTTTKTTK